MGVEWRGKTGVPRSNTGGGMFCAPPWSDVMPALFDVLTREYCRARLAEMRRQPLDVKRPRRVALHHFRHESVATSHLSHSSRAKGMVRPGACL